MTSVQLHWVDLEWKFVKHSVRACFETNVISRVKTLRWHKIILNQTAVTLCSFLYMCLRNILHIGTRTQNEYEDVTETHYVILSCWVFQFCLIWLYWWSRQQIAFHVGCYHQDLKQILYTRQIRFKRSPWSSTCNRSRKVFVQHYCSGLPTSYSCFNVPQHFSWTVRHQMFRP
jgi:hypothetical protein